MHGPINIKVYHSLYHPVHLQFQHAMSSLQCAVNIMCDILS
jgi:hypothetical protein